MEIGSIFDIFTRLVLGLGIGFVMGMTGIGAGVLVMPSLLYIVGLPPVTAVGTGLLYAMLARIYGVYEHLRLRTVRKRTAFYIALGSIPAVLGTVLIVTHLAKISGSKVDFALKLIISIVMLMTWIVMLVNLLRSKKDSSETYYVPEADFPLWRKLFGVVTGIGIGILVGATSVGGGVILVPILISVFRLSPSNTVGTSMLIAIVMAAVGSITYLMRGNVALVVAIAMVIGSIPGIALGARASVRVPHRILKLILFVIITISVIVMFAGIKS